MTEIVNSAETMEVDEIVSVDPIRNTISMIDISKNISLIVKGVESNQIRLIQRVIRQNPNIRKYISADQLQQAIKSHLTSMCPSYRLLVDSIQKLPNPPAPLSIDSFDFSPIESLIHMDLPEVEIYIFTLFVTTFLRENLVVEASQLASLLVERIRSLNRRSLDLLSSKAFFYYSFCFEKLGNLETIRPALLALFRTACLHKDEVSQAMLLNLLLRNFLSYNLIEQARTFSERAGSFPESSSNNQFCRYLYYMGRIQAVQLEYSEAHSRLLLAARKAPQECGFGFVRTVHKLLVLVKLLMGEVPERATFNQPELRTALKPYLALTQAVRTGDLKQFEEVVSAHSPSFQQDQLLSLVKRLGHNVLKIGLKKITLSYSRISLEDAARKLHLPSPQAAAYICAKAIRDGVISASLDLEGVAGGCLVSAPLSDLYSSDEPQQAFHRRIQFCTGLRADAVKGMRYLPALEKEKKGKKGEKVSEEKTIDELIREMEEGDEDD